jgi:hypothetical protein
VAAVVAAVTMVRMTGAMAAVVAAAVVLSQERLCLLRKMR